MRRRIITLTYTVYGTVYQVLPYTVYLKDATTHWNLSPEELASIAIEKGQATLTSTGAININTGEFTGRSPKDRFIVRDAITEKSVWWGDVNLSFDENRRLLQPTHL